MAFYLVDYENVNTEGLQGIEALTAADEVVIFYSIHADRLTFDLHRRINESPARVQYVKVGACKQNALDFQLVTYLGYLIAQRPSEDFYIISRDHGFRSVVTFWREKEVSVTLTGELHPAVVEVAEPVMAVRVEIPAVVQPQPTPQKKGKAEKLSLQPQIEAMFDDAFLVATVLDCLQRSKSKQDLHNRLAADLRDDRVGSIYQKVKGLL